MGIFDLFRKKTISQKVSNDREIISENERSVDSLIILATDDEKIVSDLKNLKEKIKYLVPSDEAKIIDFDKKIKNQIEDIRVALLKSDGETDKKIQTILTQIKLTISDRNARI